MAEEMSKAEFENLLAIDMAKDALSEALVIGDNVYVYTDPLWRWMGDKSHRLHAWVVRRFERPADELCPETVVSSRLANKIVNEIKNRARVIDRELGHY